MDEILSELKEIKELLIKNTLQFYTTKELAVVLRLSTTVKVDELRHYGVIRGIKRGNGWIFPKKEVDAFIEDYLDMDISNPEKILESRELVQARKLSKNRSRSYKV